MSIRHQNSEISCDNDKKKENAFTRFVKQFESLNLVRDIVIPPLPEKSNINNVNKYIANMRMHDICPYNCEVQHSLRKCPKFFGLKKKCTKYTYMGNRLLKNDYVGFCAAGVFLKCDDNILFLRENRNGEIKLNFPGGGRETISNNNTMRLETPFETAASEFVEEVGDLVVDGRRNLAVLKIKKIINKKKNLTFFWSGISKYVLILVDIDVETAKMLQPIKNVHPSSEALSFEWVNEYYLDKSLFHKYTYDFIEAIFKPL